MRGGTNTSGFGDILGNALSLLYVTRQGLKEQELWKILDYLHVRVHICIFAKDNSFHYSTLIIHASIISFDVVASPDLGAFFGSSLWTGFEDWIVTELLLILITRILHTCERKDLNELVNHHNVIVIYGYL